MNIFDAAWEAFSQGEGIGRESWPDLVIQQDDEVGFLVAVTDDDAAYVGWNPTPEDLMAEDWITKERTEIRSRVYPSDHF